MWSNISAINVVLLSASCMLLCVEAAGVPEPEKEPDSFGKINKYLEQITEEEAVNTILKIIQEAVGTLRELIQDDEQALIWLNQVVKLDLAEEPCSPENFDLLRQVTEPVKDKFDIKDVKDKRLFKVLKWYVNRVINKCLKSQEELFDDKTKESFEAEFGDLDKFDKENRERIKAGKMEDYFKVLKGALSYDKVDENVGKNLYNVLKSINEKKTKRPWLQGDPKTGAEVRAEREPVVLDLQEYLIEPCDKLLKHSVTQQVLLPLTNLARTADIYSLKRGGPLENDVYNWAGRAYICDRLLTQDKEEIIAAIIEASGPVNKRN